MILHLDTIKTESNKNKLRAHVLSFAYYFVTECPYVTVLV